MSEWAVRLNEPTIVAETDCSVCGGHWVSWYLRSDPRELVGQALAEPRFERTLSCVCYKRFLAICEPKPDTNTEANE